MTNKTTMKIIALFTVLIVSALSGCLDEPLTSKVDSPIMESIIVKSIPISAPEPTIVVTPTSTSTPVPTVVATTMPTPKSEPTVISTPMPKPTVTPTIQKKNSVYDYKVIATIRKSDWDKNTLYFRYIKSGARMIATKDHVHLQYIKIYIDEELIAEFKPTIVKMRVGYTAEELPMIIKLPDNVDISGEITAIGIFDYPEHNGFPSDDGDHPLNVCRGNGWPIGTTKEEAESADEWTRYN